MVGWQEGKGCGHAQACRRGRKERRREERHGMCSGVVEGGAGQRRQQGRKEARKCRGAEKNSHGQVESFLCTGSIHGMKHIEQRKVHTERLMATGREGHTRRAGHSLFSSLWEEVALVAAVEGRKIAAACRGRRAGTGRKASKGRPA